MAGCRCDMVVVRPGQLWMWAFSLQDGFWPFEVITNEARDSFIFAGEHLMLHRGDRFIIVATDDPGPAQPPGLNAPRFDEYGNILSWGDTSPPKRWHVAMAKDKLFWVDQEKFEHAELMGDA